MRKAFILRYTDGMKKKTARHNPQSSSPIEDLSEEHLERIESGPGFQRMADEADRDEREGRVISHEEVLRRLRPAASRRR